MGPISNIDRLVLILRQRLQEKATAGTRKATNPSTARREDRSGIDNVHALAAVEGVDDHQLGRALIQSILADHFGAEMLNEAKFQQVVDRVTEAISEDTGGAQLLSRMVGELRSARD